MVFDTYGSSALPSLLLLHGMANTAQSCYGRVVPHFEKFHVILCQLDGHTEQEDGLFCSIEDCCEKIERYVCQHLGGTLYGLSGFSMGATIAVELMARQRIEIKRVVLDGAWCVKLGALAPIYTNIFCWALGRLQAGKTIPNFLLECSMGKGNARIIDTFYQGVKLPSIRNACRDVYGYEISDGLSRFHGAVAFWRGSREPYPAKTAKLLKQYLPQMQVEVFDGLGHGQLLREQPEAYAKKLTEFMGAVEQEAPHGQAH
jgi:pimeloyl-ACP methyl ester carboxylesterase